MLKICLKSEENINITSFYEAIDFLSLSESKFQEFVENFESMKMTKLLWSKLYPCFYINYSQKNEQQKKNAAKLELQETRLAKIKTKIGSISDVFNWRIRRFGIIGDV